MSPATRSHKSNEPVLFEKGVFDLCSVVGRDINSSDREIVNTTVRAVVSKLHANMKAGHKTQPEIDRYLLLVYMEWSKSPLLALLPWQSFVLEVSHVPHLRDFVDIGAEVRAMLMNSEHRNTMHKLIQYSMPYIKHNRLNFPSFDDVHALELANMVRIIMACCLGVLRVNTKRPIFTLRVKMFAFFHTLLSTGDSIDLYIFCSTHLSLLRIDIIEYFMVFVESFLPAEKLILCARFHLENDVDEMFRSFFAIIDSFRQSTLQTSLLAFDVINQRAHNAIEKCNRITKGKTRQNKNTPTHATRPIADTIVYTAMHTPRFVHMVYASLVPQCVGMHFQSLHDIQHIHSLISVAALPANLAHHQARLVLQKFHQNSTSVYASTWLNVCMRCLVSNNKFSLANKMRVMSDGASYCSKCTSNEYVVRISTMGRIVKVHGTSFYFCVLCTCIHEWKSTGHEFFVCHRRQQPPALTEGGRLCLVCRRSTSVTNWPVLDDRLGCMHNVTLCAKHRPLPHQEAGVYNLQTLRLAILHKLNRYRVSTVEIKTL